MAWTADMQMKIHCTRMQWGSGAYRGYWSPPIAPSPLLINSVTEFTSRHCSEMVTLAIWIAGRLMARFQWFSTSLSCREGSATLLYCILVQPFGSTPEEGISSLDCYTTKKEELSNTIFRFHRFPCHYTKWLRLSRLTLFISWKICSPLRSAFVFKAGMSEYTRWQEEGEYAVKSSKYTNSSIIRWYLLFIKAVNCSC